MPLVRPDGRTIHEFVNEIKRRYPDLLLMADVSTYEEGCAAAAMTVDVVATTLCGYTKDTSDEPLPAFTLLKKLATLSIPIIAEGGIENIQQLNHAFAYGAYACVMGTAITRPREITKRLVDNMDIKYMYYARCS